LCTSQYHTRNSFNRFVCKSGDDFEDKISDENKGIKYVDFTQEDLDKYLSGNGTVTGFSVEAIELD